MVARNFWRNQFDKYLKSEVVVVGNRSIYARPMKERDIAYKVCIICYTHGTPTFHKYDGFERRRD